ncbi:MAG TPA: hypothetical protein PKC41_00520 [Chitinophagaceae bacterium]|nr:hypothetical protein [Chitinophagaceae bacterium]
MNTHKMNKYKMILNATAIVITIFSLTILFSSCRKKVSTPPNPNDEELITTLQMNFIDSAGVQASVTSIFKDADGDGGNNPGQWDTIKLKANTTYFASILLLDETKSPADTISHEVLEEGQDHLFCFTPTNINATIKASDLDVNNLAIGLQTTWYTGAASEGSVQVVLRHQPGVKTGSCTPGASDIDILFHTKID